MIFINFVNFMNFINFVKFMNFMNFMNFIIKSQLKTGISDILLFGAGFSLHLYRSMAIIDCNYS